MKTTIHYSVEDHGDGSGKHIAYPRFFTTEALAEWHQEHLSQGWVESCTGTLEIEHEGAILCSDAQNELAYYLELFDSYDNKDKIVEYVKAFFPDGIPKIDVAIESKTKYTVSSNGELIDTCYGEFLREKATWKTDEVGRAKLESNLNKRE